MTVLRSLIHRELHRPVEPAILAIARQIGRTLGGAAVLFYGSALRTGDLDGVLDFYVLRNDAPARRQAPAFLWPHVSYHELDMGGRIIRAKVATMPLATFELAARGGTIDTTIWTRFAQPARLLVANSADIADHVVDAVRACLRTASRFAAALGPLSGAPEDYWRALFRQTYGAEFRIEKQGRADTILSRDPSYYRDALVLAWRELGLIGTDETEHLRPVLQKNQRRKWRRQWQRRKIAGKPLNLMRLVRAAWTFDGAARYALWKIERHSGVAIALTPWRERHPLLAAPGVLFQLWRASSR